VDFLNHDTNGVVSFVIVRDTPETRGRGLVHGIVGNDHPNASPPTLRISRMEKKR
jgi:hypothetical protein